MNCRSVYVSIIFAAAGLAAGCGSSSSSPSTATADVTIQMLGDRGNQSYSPNPTTMRAGQTVAWHNGDTTALTMGNLGGGSDFSGFYHHLGIPSGGIGFDGPDGIYHSMYDSYDWMTRFGDPAYKAHRAGAQLVAVILGRLANSDLLPLDYAAFGTELNGLVAQLDSGIAKKQWKSSVTTQALKDALDRFTAVARAFNAARDSALARAGGVDSARAQRVNQALMLVERRLTRPEGLVSRPWFKSLQFAADLDNGYATMAFPSVNEAIRYADAATANKELVDLVNRVDQARAALVEAAVALR